MINTVSEMTFRLNILNEEQRKISYQSSTGKLLDDGSDDSKVFARDVYIKDKINVFEGLKTQVEKTSAQNSVSDTTMKEVKNLLSYIKAEVIKGLNATSDDTSREAIATNLEGVKKNLFALVNEEVEGEYVFAGSDSTVKPFSMDANGVVSYNGNGQLRRVAVEESEYRDRGITGFDAAMYTTDRAFNGEQLSFSGNPTNDYYERIVDQDGNEWKFQALTPTTTAGNAISFNANEPLVDESGTVWSYNATSGNLEDKDGNVYPEAVGGAPGPVFNVTVTGSGSETLGKAGLVKYDDENKPTTETLAVTQTAAATATEPAKYQTAALSTAGQVLEARHNVFDTIDRTINALRNRQSDGTPAADSGAARDLLSKELDNITAAYDGANVAHAKLGGRNQVFEVSLERLGAKVSQFKILEQEVASADLAEVAIKSKALELTYQALYSTVNRMNQLSLVNFVR